MHVGPVSGAGVKGKLVTLQNFSKEIQHGFESFCIHSDF